MLNIVNGLSYLKSISIVILLLVLTACSSAPTRKPQDQAIYQALVDDATMRMITDGCGQLGNTLKQDAWRARKDWWDRNKALVEGADFGFSYNMIHLTGNRQDTGARYAMALGFDVIDQAQKEANKVLKDSDEYAACQKVLATYKDGKHELRDNKKFYPILLDLAQQKREHGKDLLLEQSKVQVKQGFTYSRSSMTAEKLAKRDICPDAVVNTLKSAWPEEVFEGTCPDNSFTLIQCEWGICKVK
jgi:hypothetical protein